MNFGQETTIQDTRNRTVTGQSVCPTNPSRRLGKTHPDYWKGRLKRRSYRSSDGQTAVIPEWQIRIQFRGEEEWFNLGTTNQVVAATKARDIWLSLHAKGMLETKRAYKPGMMVASDSPTVGEFIDALKQTAQIRPATLEIYARKFRTIVAGVFNIPTSKAKHDHTTGGYAKWLTEVSSKKLALLTPERVRAWQRKYIAERSTNPISEKQAKSTVNSLLRNSRSLFSKKAVRDLTVKLPDTLPFTGIDFEKAGRSRYRSEIDAGKLLLDARNELYTANPELLPTVAEAVHALARLQQFKVFVLALGAGLRRDEIDTLTWPQVDLDRRTIRVETNEHTSTKSADSEDIIDIDDGLVALLREFKSKSKSDFVIDSAVSPRQTTTYHHYRSQRTFAKLTAWLRGKGMKAKQPIHSLRKEFGSLIAAQGGIYAASTQLRHADIRITRDHYLDRKTRVVVGLGGMLNGANSPLSSVN